MASVVLRLERKNLFVGSYTPMQIEINPGSGLTIDDLDFKINTGLAGGVVSLPPAAPASTRSGRS